MRVMSQMVLGKKAAEKSLLFLTSTLRYMGPYCHIGMSDTSFCINELPISGISLTHETHSSLFTEDSGH